MEARFAERALVPPGLEEALKEEKEEGEAQEVGPQGKGRPGPFRKLPRGKEPAPAPLGHGPEEGLPVPGRPLPGKGEGEGEAALPVQENARLLKAELVPQGPTGRGGTSFPPESTKGRSSRPRRTTRTPPSSG